MNNTTKASPFYCTDQRDGRRVHVNSQGSTVNGPSRLVHAGGRIACDDGRIPESPVDYSPATTGLTVTVSESEEYTLQTASWLDK